MGGYLSLLRPRCQYLTNVNKRVSERHTSEHKFDHKHLKARLALLLNGTPISSRHSSLLFDICQSLRDGAAALCGHGGDRTVQVIVLHLHF